MRPQSLIISLFLISLIFFIGGVHTAIAEEVDTYSPERQRIEERLSSKYKIKKMKFTTRADGSVGSVNIDGDLTPPGLEKKGGSLENQRQMARAFLEEERQLLGVGGLQGFDVEFRETRLFGGLVYDKSGNSSPTRNFEYYIYIEGINVKASDINLTLSAEGGIRSIDVNTIVYITPEMADAARRSKPKGIDKIDKEEAKAIVAEDMFARGFKFEDESTDYYFFNKYISPIEPYVKWDVGAIFYVLEGYVDGQAISEQSPSEGVAVEAGYTLDALDGSIPHSSRHLRWRRQ